MIRREITWRRIEDFIIKKCWSVSTLVPCLNLLPIELQWPIFLQNRVTPSMSFNLAFIVCLFSRTLCPASHPPRTLALISPTLVPNSRTLERCSRKLKGQNALGLFSHTFAHANLDFACANLNFYFWPNYWLFHTFWHWLIDQIISWNLQFS
jgi:hypothetical protein